MLSLAIAPACAGEASEQRPNFVLVLADDLGWSDVGCQGSTFHRTPCIDALAGEGLRFTAAYAASPVCSPSRASLFTGKHPARLHLTELLGIRTVAGEPGPANSGPADRKLWQPVVRDSLPPGETTFAARLREADYRTALIGKWHLNPEPESVGFDVAIGASVEGAAASYFPPYGVPGLESAAPGEYLTDRLTDEAVAFLEENRDRPFALVLSHYAVHSPWQAKPELEQRYAELADPAALQNNPTYAAMIESLDQSVGRIVEALERLGLREKTLFVLTSDNGGFEVFRGSKRKRAQGVEPVRLTSNAPLRAGKGQLYEGGIRVPFLVAGPGVVRGSCDVPIVGTDLYPTLLSLAGIAPTERVDGVDLAPLFGGGKELRRERLLFHFPHQTFASSIRRGDKKLIHLYLPDKDELYDLAADPGEAEDLAAREPELARELARELFEGLAEMDAHLPVRNPDFRPGAPAGASDEPESDEED